MEIKIKTRKYYKICSATSQIKSWLDDSGRKWEQQENPNCFTSDKLEALYVYDNKIKYWEDVRGQSAVEEHSLPKNKNELYSILYKIEPKFRRV